MCSLCYGFGLRGRLGFRFSWCCGGCRFSSWGWGGFRFRFSCCWLLFLGGFCCLLPLGLLSLLLSPAIASSSFSLCPLPAWLPAPAACSQVWLPLRSSPPLSPVTRYYIYGMQIIKANVSPRNFIRIMWHLLLSLDDVQRLLEILFDL